MALRRFVVPLALALSVSGVALAAPSAQDRTEAAQLTIKSRNAAQKKNMAEAIELARKADALDPTAARKIELAKMLVDGGKLVEASQILNALVNDPALPPGDKWAKDAAKKQLGTFESRIPWLTVVVNGPTKGAHVKIDGKEAEAGAETPVDPGEHAISADADGYDSADTTITVPEGAHKSVSLTLNVAPNSKPKEEEKPSGPGTGSLLAAKWPALAAGGVGVAGIALGAVFGVLAINEADKARSFCKGNVCPNLPEVVDARNVSIANGNVSTAGFIVGGLGLAGGVALWFLIKGDDKGKDQPAKKDALVVQPYVGVGSAGLVGSF